jgi:UDP-3-O-[3-hydroxymyristoyl] glucosamine N-acyltransferase
MITALEIAEKVQGELIGEAKRIVSGISILESATSADLSFYNQGRYKKAYLASSAGIILVSRQLYSGDSSDATVILVKDAYAAFLSIASYFTDSYDHDFPLDNHLTAHFSVNIGKGTVIGKGAVIGKNSIIYPNVSIGNHVVIGDGCLIYPNVTIYNRTKIGNNVIIHAGAVIGADGFGFSPTKDNTYAKIPQLGNVVIEEDVEIGANTCIDRATFGATIIRRGVKLDNLIQVAHNVEIGEHTVIAAQAGISGSTKLGHHCQIGGQAGFVGHISIAPFTLVNAQSGVSKGTQKQGLKLSGSPAIDFNTYYKAYARFKNL